MNRRVRYMLGGLENADKGLVFSISVLIFMGIFVVYGAGSYNRLASSTPLGQHFIIARHLFMIGVGGALMFALANVDYHYFKRRWLNWGGLVISLALVGWTLFGDRDINRWITLGGFRFQPVEIAKLAVVLFMAERLTGLARQKTLSWRRLLTTLAMGPLPLLIILALQPNFGNVMTLSGVTLVVLFVAGVVWRRMAIIVLAPLGAGVAAFLLSAKLGNRLDAWWDGVRQGNFGYQVDQSLVGLGGGGWHGLGLGQSHNKFSFLPEAHTDFIFSVLGEELGLFGTLGVIAMLVLFVWRGYSIAGRAADPFGQVVATGLTTSLAIYGLANIAMVTGVFPVVGVPLPFVSYGGTAMIAALASVGILLNIDRHARSHHLWKRNWSQNATLDARWQ